MFGCEPKLPVDFLLGTDAEVAVTEDWVQQHQDQMRTAQEYVRQQIAMKAEQRNQANNDQVTDTGFDVGALVYLRNHQVRGRIRFETTGIPVSTGWSDVRKKQEWCILSFPHIKMAQSGKSTAHK